MSEQLTAQHFLPHVNKIFRVRDGRHALTLSRVETMRAGGGPREQFNLIFTGPPRDVLAEGLYTLDVDDGPHFELYVIPVHTPTLDRQDYQAAFN